MLEKRLVKEKLNVVLVGKTFVGNVIKFMTNLMNVFVNIKINVIFVVRKDFTIIRFVSQSVGVIYKTN
jgi:hypothetical protein